MGFLKWRVVYGVLWFLTVVVYSIPWVSVNGKVYTGWSFTVPFSFTYVIGIVLGLIVLLICYKPVSMTVIAGILMILGVFGALFGYTIMSFIHEVLGAKATTEAGGGLAFIISIIYTVVGAIAGERMMKKR